MADIHIKGYYEGYLWWSDATKPDIVSPDKLTEKNLISDDNPFIVEGELYDKVKGESITIRYVDGRYIVNTFKVEASHLNGSDHATLKEYFAQRMPHVQKLRYLQLWKAEKDSLCEGMETLCPSNLVFIGFVKDNKEE